MSSTIDFFPTEYSSATGAPETNVNTGAFDSQTTYGLPTGRIGGNSYSNPETFSNFGEEPPLWEELGIDPDLIKTKTISILLRRHMDDRLLRDEDLGGPFVFCILLGASLLLQGGKLHFGYIFGYSILGSIALYLLLNLMTEQSIGLYHTMSILGYCLTPMVLLAFSALVLPPASVIGLAIAIVVIAFCTHAASLIFVKVLQTHDQRYLFAYPIGLLYTCFALIVMF